MLRDAQYDEGQLTVELAGRGKLIDVEEMRRSGCKQAGKGMDAALQQVWSGY